MSDRRIEGPITIDELRQSDLAALTRGQVAQLLGVDPRTVTRAIDEGQLPSMKLGRRVLIPREPLLRVLEADAPGLSATPQSPQVPG
jgi:excisionase family DNA binding protein